MQRIGYRVHCGNRFDPDLGNHGVVDIGGSVAKFHFDQLHSLFNAAANAAETRVGWITRRRRRIGAHENIPQPQVCWAGRGASIAYGGSH
jgi:hypothetical protein